MKKILKITGLTLLILIILLALAPFIFQSQIKNMVRNFINDNLNAKVEFADVSLSFISSFPQANIIVDELKITNFEPFKNEVLASVKSFSFDMSIQELFKTSNENPVTINSIIVDEALVTLKTNKFGDANWDIAKQKKSANDITSTSETFILDIKDYAINKSALSYLDEVANTKVYVTELNHSGKGTFSETESTLDTKSTANITLDLDEVEYLSNNKIGLDALIDLDLKQNKYTFKENKGYINNLPLEFNGYIENLENGQNIELNFENPGSDFKDFLAVIPETYSKNISDVKTFGNFKFNGIIKGLISEETIPTLDINVVSKNASFKYPDLPKSVQNISINASVKNTTGKMEDTFLDIKTLNFKIDEDDFKSSVLIKNLTGNQIVNANIDGVLNLANITKTYPVELNNELSGILKAKLNTNFDMDAIQTNAYDHIKNSGNLSINDFKFSSADVINPINISEANINFNTTTVTLESFKATTGKTDIDAKGTISNLLGFLLSNKKLKGDFKVSSNTFLINDFMVEGGSEKPINQSTEPDDALKIPAFLDCSINADAKTVIYDNLTLKEVKGTLVIKDEKANLQKVTSNIFDGNLTLSGIVDTKTEAPTFDMNLGAENFDISKSFKDLDLLKSIAPIAEALQGKLNSAINISGNLGDDFTPILNTISGGALAELLTTSVEPKKAKLFDALTNKLSFIEFDKLDLKDLKTALTFDKGKVNLSPFNIYYKDITINIGGSHGFDKTMNYNLVFNVPAKYLGSEVNRLIGKINDNEINNISIPITANLTGDFSSPQVSTDLSSGVKQLTAKLIEIEKQKLLNEGKDKINDLLGEIIGNDKIKDSTNIQENAPVKDIIKDVILGGESTPNTKDSINTTNNTVKNIISLFGKKKKKKDSVK